MTIQATTTGSRVAHAPTYHESRTSKRKQKAKKERRAALATTLAELRATNRDGDAFWLRYLPPCRNTRLAPLHAHHRTAEAVRALQIFATSRETIFGQQPMFKTKGRFGSESTKAATMQHPGRASEHRHQTVSAANDNWTRQIQPGAKVPLFERAVLKVICRWSSLPWKWNYAATEKKQRPYIYVNWEDAPRLPRLLARLALAHALKLPAGASGADAEGRTEEYWIVTEQVVAASAGFRRGWPWVDRCLDKALKHFDHPIPANWIGSRLGGTRDFHPINQPALQVIEDLRHNLLSQFALTI